MIFDLTKRSGGTGEWTTDGLADGTEPNGGLTIGTTEIEEYMFYNRRSIDSVSSNTVIKVKAYAFGNCTGLTSISFPNATNVEQSSFYNTGLTLVGANALPKAGGIKQSVFAKCASLIGIVMPSVKGSNNVGYQCVANCSALQYIDIGNYTGGLSFATGALQNSGTSTLILRYNTIVGMANVNVFNGTVFASGGTGGTIYIPKSLYDHLGDGTADDYKAATNWSTVDGYGTITWKSIESTHTDPNAPIDLTLYYADGTPIPTA